MAAGIFAKPNAALASTTIKGQVEWGRHRSHAIACVLSRAEHPDWGGRSLTGAEVLRAIFEYRAAPARQKSQKPRVANDPRL
jgi:hypothetical protein